MTSLASIRLRSMRTQDIYAVQELVAEHGDSLFTFVNLLAYCLQAGHEAVVAESAGQIVGVVAGIHRADESHVDVVCVRTDFRGIGIATALLGRFSTAAGRKPITLEVAVTNVSAQRLYSSLGYVPAQKLPGYYAKTDGLRMRVAPIAA